MTVDDVIRDWQGETPDHTLLQRLAAELGVPFAVACNRLALNLARSFLEGSISYPQADGVANTLWTVILEAARPHAPAGEEHFPEPAVSIFEAFDAGEYVRQGDDRDPVETFTVPRLRELLADAE